jgi:phosphoglycolate phosphatase
MATVTIPGHRFAGIRLVIFDKDGTLMELHHYWTEMCKFRVNLVAERFPVTPEQKDAMLLAMGVDIAQKKLLPDGPVGIKKREVVMQAAVDYLASIGYPDTKAACHQVFEEVDIRSAEMLRQIVIPIPGAKEVVGNLVASGCKIAIATTDRSGRAALAMQEMGLGGEIDLVIGADRVSETKPNPEMIFQILKTLKITKDQALMVGDAITDIEMGNHAGLAGTIAVLTGQTPKEILKKNTPFVISSVADIKVADRE